MPAQIKHNREPHNRYPIPESKSVSISSRSHSVTRGQCIQFTMWAINLNWVRMVNDMING